MKNHFWPLTWKGDEWKKLRNIRKERKVLRWKLGKHWSERRGEGKSEYGTKKQRQQSCDIYLYTKSSSFPHFEAIQNYFPFSTSIHGAESFQTISCAFMPEWISLYSLSAIDQGRKKNKNHSYVCVYTREGKRKRKQEKKREKRKKQRKNIHFNIFVNTHRHCGWCEDRPFENADWNEGES